MDNSQHRTKPSRWPLIIIVIVSTLTIFNTILLGGRQAQSEPTTSTAGTQTEEPGVNLFHLERVGNDRKFDFYRDPVTDVMYLCLSDYNESGLTAMLDPETGLPLTYARYMDLYKQQITTKEQLGEQTYQSASAQ